VKSADYERAGIPMMPNARGADTTRTQILLYTLLLAPVGVLPAMFGFGGLAYLAVSVLTGLWMVVLAWRIYRRREGDASVKASWSLFGFSIIYLFALFVTLLVEHGFGLFIAMPGFA
jgi:protoheme IX farnesyltransferase